MATNEEVKVEDTNTSTQDQNVESKEEITATNVNSSQETEDEQVDEDLDDNDIEFDDSDTADDDDLDNDEEETKTQTKTQNKPLNKREYNREKAKQRREKREKELHNSYLKGVKTATGEINPYTNMKMETDEDVQDYLDMKEMESQGLDPTDSRDYIKFMRDKQKVREEEARKVAEENQRKEESNNKFQKELMEFKTKYSDVDIVNLVNNDSMWGSLIIPQIQSGKTLTEAYESVNNLINKSINERVDTLADEKAKKQVQNQFASVGSQTIGEDMQDNQVDIWSMSDEEFREYQKKRGL